MTDAEFDQYVLHNRTALVNYAYKLIGDRDCDDVVQDAIIEAWHDRTKFTTMSDKSFRLWVGRYIFYKVNSARRVRSRIDLIGREPYEEAANPGISVNDHREILRLIETCNLTDKQRMAVTEWLNGRTQTDIGATLGVRQESVRDHIARAKSKINAARDEFPRRHWFDFISEHTLNHANRTRTVSARQIAW